MEKTGYSATYHYNSYDYATKWRTRRGRACAPCSPLVVFKLVFQTERAREGGTNLTMYRTMRMTTLLASPPTPHILMHNGRLLLFLLFGICGLIIIGSVFYSCINSGMSLRRKASSFFENRGFNSTLPSSTSPALSPSPSLAGLISSDTASVIS